MYFIQNHAPVHSEVSQNHSNNSGIPLRSLPISVLTLKISNVILKYLTGKSLLIFVSTSGKNEIRYYNTDFNRHCMGRILDFSSNRNTRICPSLPSLLLKIWSLVQVLIWNGNKWSNSCSTRDVLGNQSERRQPFYFSLISMSYGLAIRHIFPGPFEDLATLTWNYYFL